MTYKTHYDETCLLKKDDRYVMTRVKSYKRYKNTIEPLEKFLAYLEEVK